MGISAVPGLYIPSAANQPQSQVRSAPQPVANSIPYGSVANTNSTGDGALYYDTGTGKVMSNNIAGSSTLQVPGIDTGYSGGSGSGSGSAGPSAGQLAGPTAALASLDGILANKNTQSQQEHDTAINGYNAQDAIDQGQQADAVAKNESTYTGNNQSALLNAANASTGLRGVLASLGALGGSGMDIVRHLVGLASNSDTGAAQKNFDTNATALNNAGQTMDQVEKQRRLNADSTLQNNLQDNSSNVLTSRQSILNQLATLFGAGTAQGNDYASQAATLTPQIAATTRASVAPYAAASSTYSPAALQSYLAGTQNLNVGTSADANTPAPLGPINAPGASQKTKDTLSGVA